ncbi:MAG: hypothetical protein JW860_11225 [Sedimentisphaerales bacterium]|nr:hypothetical protein [Sedimentisphaerales bacterium]
MGAIGARGRERARRMVCAAQLSMWGEGIFMAMNDRDGQVLEPYTENWYSADLLPFNVQNTESYDDPEVIWSVETINPYLELTHDMDRYDILPESDPIALNEIIACPSSDVAYMKQSQPLTLEPAYLTPGYCYYGRIDKAPSDLKSDRADLFLTKDFLSEDRILMSDILTCYNDIFCYNHGLTGSSFYPRIIVELPSNIIQNGQQAATGRNQLFGDGHVKWRSISQENNLPDISDTSWREPGNITGQEWNGYGSGFVCIYFF